MEKINIKMGAIIRERRVSLGMSMDVLAQKVGVTYQQIQKYEKGVNSLTVARLIEIAAVLGMNPQEFFYDKIHAKSSASDRETLELVKAFNGIKSNVLRKKIWDLIRGLR